MFQQLNHSAAGENSGVQELKPQRRKWDLRDLAAKSQRRRRGFQGFSSLGGRASWVPARPAVRPPGPAESKWSEIPPPFSAARPPGKTNKGGGFDSKVLCNGIR